MKIMICGALGTSVNVMIITKDDTLTPEKLAAALMARGAEFQKVFQVQGGNEKNYTCEKIAVKESFVKGALRVEADLRCCAAYGSERAIQLIREAKSKVGEGLEI